MVYTAHIPSVQFKSCVFFFVSFKEQQSFPFSLVFLVMVCDQVLCLRCRDYHCMNVQRVHLRMRCLRVCMLLRTATTKTAVSDLKWNEQKKTRRGTVHTGRNWRNKKSHRHRCCHAVSEESKSEESRSERDQLEWKMKWKKKCNSPPNPLEHTIMGKSLTALWSLLASQCCLCSRKIILCGNVANGYRQSNFDRVTSRRFLIS